MCSIHTYTHTNTHTDTHSHCLLFVAGRRLMHWKNDLTAPVPLPNLRSSFFTNLGSHLWHPQPPPVTCWPRLCCGSERERESALCVLQIYDLKCDFEKRIWRNIFCLCLCQRLGLRLLVSSFRLPSFRLTFHFCRSHSIFFLFFYFFLCCPFADKHIRVLLFLFFLYFVVLFTYFIFICSLFGAVGLWDMLMMPCCLSSMRKDASIVALVPGQDNPRADGARLKL